MKLRVVALFYIVAGLCSAVAYAQPGSARGSGPSRRSGAPQENVSWNLTDWLAQKQKFKLMDQWLAVNKQSHLVEFNLDGGQTNYDMQSGTTTKSHKFDHYDAAFYLSIFGIEGGFEKSNESRDATYGQMNLRILGQSSQSTSITAGYGARKIDDSANDHEVTNQYSYVNLQLYLASFLGIDGDYRRYFSAKDESDTDYEGERIEYGAFLEYKFVRIYGKSFTDRNYTRTSAGVVKNELRDGVNLGVKLFF